MTPKEILIEARRLLVEKGWTQGTWARNAEGRDVSSLSKDAVCFCAAGALWAADTARFGGAAAALVLRAIKSSSLAGARRRAVCIGTFNDYEGRTKEEVISIFDKAIEMAE